MTQTQSPQYLDNICELVHQQFMEAEKSQGTKEYLSHNDENILVPWNQLSPQAQERQRQWCIRHLNAFEQVSGQNLRTQLEQAQPKSKAAGA